MPDVKLLDLPINELKRQLATSNDLGEVMRFFFDHFAENQGFIEASHRIQVPEALREGIRPLIAKYWPNQTIAGEWAVAEVTLLGLVHGTVRLDSDTAVVLWAPSLSVGVIALPNLKAGEIVYARISIIKANATRQ
jgi:hypothetical protein